MPVPMKKGDTIGNYDERLEHYKSEKKTIEAKQKTAEKSLKNTRETLVSVAASIQKNQSLIQSLDTQISEQEEARTALLDALDGDRLAVSRLILALGRLRRTPPQAMIARPNAPIETARSAMLMEEIIPALNSRAQDLKDRLAQLEAIDQDLKKKKEQALVTAKKLEQEKKSLDGLVRTREKLYAQMDHDLKARQAKIKEISAQSKNLNDLVQKLEDERSRGMKSLADKSRNVGSDKDLPKIGDKQLPLSGILRVAYNENDALGAKSKGVTIEGRPAALIVAPMGGIVRYAGPFQSYGNMVILEHKNGYHSLVAGFEKIDTVVGQSLLAGEPLGHLRKKTSSGKTPDLYFELRHKGTAVNPAKLFSELKS